MGWGCASGVRSAGREPVRITAPFSARTIPGRALASWVHRLLMPASRRGLLLSALVFVARSAPAAAQPGFDAIALDRLQIQSLGLSAGWVNPSQLLPAKVYALQAEYG